MSSSISGRESSIRATITPDFVIPLAQAVASGMVDRGVAVCGSGVGASVCANKIPGVRAGPVQDHYSAHQGVEHDDMNILCMGGRVVGPLAARDLVDGFLGARFTGEERHIRRLGKVAALEAAQRASEEIRLRTGPCGRSREGLPGRR
jgi:ribose 5-phosphate isomerase B